MVNRLREKLNVTERRACRVLGRARSTQRRRVKVRDDEDALTVRTAPLAAWYGRYGYRRITALLRIVLQVGRSAQNWYRIGVNCRQPAVVARPGHHQRPSQSKS
jgi:hypothetical protein